MRVETRTLRLFTKSRHLYTALKTGCQRTVYLASQLHKFAGICPVDGWDGAGSAKVTCPGSPKQAAFLAVAAAIVVAIKILAFGSGRCFHSANRELPQYSTAGGFF
jgi:hypothetical protein